MKKVGIFYGPQGGSTEKVAKLIADQFDGAATLVSIDGVSVAEVNKYDCVIFGIATLGRETWGASTKDGWDVFFPELDKVEVKDKVFAIFGTGDHLAYANHFVDAMGHVGQKLIDRGARIVGKCATCDYTFNESEAVIDGEFVGLPIDDIYEKEKTEDRVKNWSVRLKNRFV